MILLKLPTIPVSGSRPSDERFTSQRRAHHAPETSASRPRDERVTSQIRMRLIPDSQTGIGEGFYFQYEKENILPL